MKTSVAKSGRSVRIATRLVPPFSLPSCRSHAGTSKSAIPPSLMASSTAWFTMPTASRCVESPCGRNAIRHRTRRRNEPKSTSLSASWGCHDSDRKKQNEAFLWPLPLADDLDQFSKNSRAGFTERGEVLGNLVDHDGCLSLVPRMVSADRWHMCKLLIRELLIRKSNRKCVLSNGH